MSSRLANDVELDPSLATTLACEKKQAEEWDYSSSIYWKRGGSGRSRAIVLYYVLDRIEKFYGVLGPCLNPSQSVQLVLYCLELAAQMYRRLGKQECPGM